VLGLNQRWHNKHSFAPSSDTSVTPHRFPPPWTVASIGPVLINEVFFQSISLAVVQVKQAKILAA
jgi:hypothetical protein